MKIIYEITFSQTISIEADDKEEAMDIFEGLSFDHENIVKQEEPEILTVWWHI